MSTTVTITYRDGREETKQVMCFKIDPPTRVFILEYADRIEFIPFDSLHSITEMRSRPKSPAAGHN